MIPTDKNTIIDFTDPSFKAIERIFTIVIVPIFIVLLIYLVKSGLSGEFLLTSYLQSIATTVFFGIIMLIILTLIHEFCHWFTAKLFGISCKIGFNWSFSFPASVTFPKGQVFTKREFITIAIAPFFVSLILLVSSLFLGNDLQQKLIVLLILITNITYCVGDISFVAQAQGKIFSSQQRIMYIGNKNDHRYTII